ncbi:glutamine ABC transporter ATP-binding protein, partial [Methanofollis fontis]
DEPTSALDPELTREVIEVMKNLSRDGMTMLVVTHEMGFALSAASEILFMEHGRIVEQGSPAEVRSGSGFERTRAFVGKLGDFRDYNDS